MNADSNVLLLPLCFFGLYMILEAADRACAFLHRWCAAAGMKTGRCLAFFVPAWTVMNSGISWGSS